MSTYPFCNRRNAIPGLPALSCSGPVGSGKAKLYAKVDPEDYEWLSQYEWYACYDPASGETYAAHDTPGGRRVFMHAVVMGLDTLDDELAKEMEKVSSGDGNE